MKKMDKKWVILCSTAIAAIYAADYVSTDTQAAIDQPMQHIANNVQKYHKSNNNKVINRTPKSLYKNGTYIGTGTNRRGSIDVAVTIKNDKVINVEISNFEMHYSESDIVELPNEVVQNQSAKVTNVSGATYSTKAFEDAVQDALYQAKNVAG
ncbi:FMN-binding protein [Aneurinibacillus uraniidurans]|uniref:FMN-binding protein n=1 Tax=Aneurinibacillus uraniidurans TaxID=2966586 RepID=UPI00234B4D0D|nr:FMN-binding protein [Aneurinibacillus sp. B1]WCN36268.1 FMN-binding protein [Aneurinibacillus sp. B1]